MPVLPEGASRASRGLKSDVIDSRGTACRARRTNLALPSHLSRLRIQRRTLVADRAMDGVHWFWRVRARHAVPLLGTNDSSERERKNVVASVLLRRAVFSSGAGMNRCRDGLRPRTGRGAVAEHAVLTAAAIPRGRIAYLSDCLILLLLRRIGLIDPLGHLARMSRCEYR